MVLRETLFQLVSGFCAIVVISFYLKALVISYFFASRVTAIFLSVMNYVV
jgi:hypothetical protein